MGNRVDYQRIVDVYSNYQNSIDHLESMISLECSLQDEIKHLLHLYLQRELVIIFEGLPVERVNQDHLGIPVSKLKTKYTNFYSLTQAKLRDLVSINGIGDATADLIITTTRSIQQQIEQNLKIEFHQNTKNEQMLPLLTKVYFLLSLSEQFLQAKVIQEKYPIQYHLNDFHCFKNFLTYSLTSNKNKQKAFDQFNELVELINGPFTEEVNLLYEEIQQVTKVKHIQFQTYLDHSAKIISYLSTLDPVHFLRKDETLRIHSDFKEKQDIYILCKERYQTIIAYKQADEKKRENIKKKIKIIREVFRNHQINQISLDTVYDRMFSKYLLDHEITTLSQIVDLPLATLTKVVKDQEKAVEIKQTAMLTIRQNEDEPLSITDYPQLITMIEDYLQNGSIMDLIQKKLNHMIDYSTKLQSSRIYENEKRYLSSTSEEIKIANEAIDYLQEHMLLIDEIIALLDSEISSIEVDMNDVILFANRLVPGSFIQQKKKNDLIQTIYDEASLEIKLQILKSSFKQPYASFASIILDQTNIVEIQEALSKLNQEDLISKEEMNQYLDHLKAKLEDDQLIQIELVVSNHRNKVTTLKESFEFRQIDGIEEGKKESHFTIYFIDVKGLMLSNRVSIEANQEKGSIYKRKFEFKNQSYLEEGYQMVIENQYGRIVQTYPFLFDISFANDFDF